MPKIDLGKVIGKDFKYEDFTPEQLKALQIKGDAGDNKINVVKDGVKTREDLTLQQEGKFTKIVSGTSNSHKLLASDILTEDGNPIMDTVAQYSNPNLLINGGFQVWQRGETLIVNDNSSPYTADRHRVSISDVGDYSKITHTKDGYKLETTKVVASANRYLCYQMEKNDFEKLKGKEVTFSIKVRKLTQNSKVKLSVYGTFGTSAGKEIVLQNTEFETFAFTYLFRTDILETSVLYTLDNISTEIGGGFEVAYIKLELGSIATPFVPRQYAEELAMCQRYYFKLGGGFVTFADFSVYDNRMEFLMHKKFRISPTVKVTQGIVCYAIEGHANMVYTNPSVVASPDGYCCIVGTTIPYGKTGKIQTNGPGCLIEFDAEIY